jgi:dUTPase
MSRKFEYVSTVTNPDFSLPKRSTKYSAGYDFFAQKE